MEQGERVINEATPAEIIDGALNEQNKLTYNVRELAEALGVSVTKAYNVIHIKGFPAIFIGKRAIIPRKELSEWLTAQAAKAVRGENVKF